MLSSTHTSHEALSGGHWAITCASSDTNWLNLFLSAKRLDAVLTVMGYTVCSAGKHKRLSELRSVSGPDQTHEPGKRKTTQKQRSASSKRCGRRPSSDAYCYVNCFAKARRTFEVHINSGGRVEQLLRHAVLRGRTAASYAMSKTAK